MAQITLNIPNDKVQVVLNSFDYQPTLPDGTPNPETPSEYMKRVLIGFVKSSVLNYEIRKETEKIVPEDIIIT